MDCIDLNSLTESERDIILKVIQRNDDLLKDEKFNCLKLENDIKTIRRKGVLKSGQDASKSCARCRCEFGFFFGPKGQTCPQCGQLVCDQCRIMKPTEKDADIQYFRSSDWICDLCYKQKQLKAMNGEWFFAKNDSENKASHILKTSIRRKERHDNSEDQRSTEELSDTQSQNSQKSSCRSSPQILAEVTTTASPSENDQQMLNNLIKSSSEEYTSDITAQNSPKPSKPSRTLKQVKNASISSDDVKESSYASETISSISNPSSKSVSSLRVSDEQGNRQTVPVINILEATLSDSIDDLVEANIYNDSPSFSDTSFNEDMEADTTRTPSHDQSETQNPSETSSIERFLTDSNSNDIEKCVDIDDDVDDDVEDDVDGDVSMCRTSYGVAPLRSIPEASDSGDCKYGDGSNRKTLLTGIRFSVEENVSDSSYVDISYRVQDETLPEQAEGDVFVNLKPETPSINDELVHLDGRRYNEIYDDIESAEDALSDISEHTEPDDVPNEVLAMDASDINAIARREMLTISSREGSSFAKQNTIDLLEDNDCADSEPFADIYDTNYRILETMNSTGINDTALLNECTESPIVRSRSNNRSADVDPNIIVVAEVKPTKLKTSYSRGDNCDKINIDEATDVSVRENVPEKNERVIISALREEEPLEDCKKANDLKTEKDENSNFSEEENINVNTSTTSSLTLLSISQFNRNTSRQTAQTSSPRFAEIAECDRNSDADSLGSNHAKTVSTVSNCSNESIDTAFSNHTHQTENPLFRSMSLRSSNLLSPFSGSTDSMISVYSMGGEGANYGKFPITGDIYLSMQYDYRKEIFEVNIIKCRELGIADTKRFKKTDPYVKLYLLPDRTRNGKRKTSTKRNTSNPIYDETYRVNKSELENRALWISIWHADSFGRNEFLGETTINSDILIDDELSIPRWFPLQAKATNTLIPKAYKGDIDIAMRIMKRDESVVQTKKSKNNTSIGNRLEVRVIRAINLTAVRSNGSSDPFCKGYLLPSRRRKQKTSIKKKDCNPEWGEKDLFIFELLSDQDELIKEELKIRGIELTIWDYDRLTSNDFLGGVRLNLGEGHIAGQKIDWMDARDKEVEIWHQLLDSKPGVWLNVTLPLRESMDTKLSLF